MAILTEENYVSKAENVIKRVKEKFAQSEKKRKSKENDKLTISKIRNLLSLTSTMYDELQTKEFDDLLDRKNYLIVQLAYQSGRENAVEVFVEEAELILALKECDTKEKLIRYCRYMEALVAYFKYYGGKDQ